MDAFVVPVLPESAETAIAGAVLANRVLRSEAANKPAASFCFLWDGDGPAITVCTENSVLSVFEAQCS